MKVEALLKLIKVKQIEGVLPAEVTDITTDSRTAGPGSIFVASKGYTVDSHRFIPNVMEQGCQLVVTDHRLDLDIAQIIVTDTLRVASIFAQAIFDYPATKLKTFGVTGTNGKTSVATMIHHLHRALDLHSAYLGTNGLQLDEEVKKGANSTPETVTLTKSIVKALERGADAMSFEVSSHGLVLGRLNGIDFDVAIFTNLTQDHLDFHGTMKDYGYAKSLLFSQLGNHPSYAVLNSDDSFSETLRTVTSREILTYAIDSAADFKATHIEETIYGTTFTLHSPEGDYQVESPYLGRFNIYNIMAAVAALFAAGHSIATVTSAIPTLPPVEGRLEVLDRSLPIDLIIDYAHTPDGMNKLIDAVQPFVKGKLIFLVGMAGERDLTKTAEMGAIACRADYVIFTPDNPANDDPKKLTDALEAGATHERFRSFDDRKAGIQHAIDMAEPGDMVVLASKGREPYQIMANYVKVPHRDDLIGIEAAYSKFGGPDENQTK
ncbi:UDP-N-acetylmuramoyl-L-alanyl-D-glutamate--L-lysine ligase [Macrococcus hajekii]|uniref:UDP-N-acetylmuramoyl-L-alanyl-D-glutamate--L-lysine ligase n=1 Tax=Macrococcus hajekii TaxID=198482 RepID=A0A4R6BNG0_9STAP|nr:UDP-N-acetylmuramoyl-L-alanyl-D-glutamate--L-lysine ligase [Macrococcus hajekii]TDM03399.1 UDP-N-acetylmuramoyl-L-alanyl-D-glutamate--L-lysine ligase [Macrococcus hajekii]GGA98541.1 UDP-N-acetylmuramoyl-L-alanyl-D-glutamate--L-lysine ligase [Macrococcus hajekii]